MYYKLIPRRHWLKVATIVVLLAMALAAGCGPAAPSGTVASSEPLPPEPAPAQQTPQEPAEHREQDGIPPNGKEPATYPNLDANLNRMAESSKSTTNGRTAGQSADPILVTFYVEPEQVDAVRQYLEDEGIFVRNVGADYIEAHVPPDALGVVSEQPGVLRVDTVIPPRRQQSQTRAVSQGVGLHGADAWHVAGYQGVGVKVGIIDGGFEGFARLQGTELPSSVTARCYFQGPQEPSSNFADCVGEGSHGTEVAETLVDIAPNVQLYIANAYSGGDLQNAVSWMAGQGVQVVNASLGWMYDGPGDGTSPYSNSPLNIIDQAVANGITWVNAGGNEARNVWYGAPVDPDNDGWLNFKGDWEVNQLAVAEGAPIFAVMRWDDDWDRADCDLDLDLARWDETASAWVTVVRDDRPQDGGAGKVPLAWVELDRSVDADYALSILKNTCTSSPAWIQLIAWSPVIGLQYPSPSHHMGNPEESRNPGMLAVGAAHYWNTNVIASYSSRGPTVDGRTKPDITGVACGQTSISSPATMGNSQCWFPGTSQSAPHVAGLAALVQQRFPDYQPTAVTQYLRQNASDRGTTGADNVWGHGLATLPAVVATQPPTKPVVAATATAGELRVTWNAVAGAQFYTVGWVNIDEYSSMSSAGRDWLDAFHYATVPSTHTSHIVSSLQPGGGYFVIIGAGPTRFGGEAPVWSPWTNLVTTSGQHGEGFCPITGLAIPEGGYLAVGDTQTFGTKPTAWIDVTLNSATTPTSVDLGNGESYEAPRGLKLLDICVTVANGIGSDAYFEPGTHNNLSTDKGIGFVRVTDWPGLAVPDGDSRTACDAWTIPESATTAVYAIGYSKAGGVVGETLYKIDLPSN